MEKEKETHLEVMRELSSTNKQLSDQLLRSMEVIGRLEQKVYGYNTTCRQIFEQLDHNKNRNTTESTWHKALHGVLKEHNTAVFIV